ncbi:MAG: hypothetical protein Ct9H300mP8_02700 [Gammaproteobacteria bacterium]|nr:MAG: hypothetical protein Ct9H300mP8_02700 [Gammaproteobacteria bacterium]
MEKEGALAVSLFPGFPHADIPQAGLSVVVAPITNWNSRNDSATSCWRGLERTFGFVYKVEPLDLWVAKAKQLGSTQQPKGPVVLLDHYDNTASGEPWNHRRTQRSLTSGT